jgi:hypothetical protein
MKLFRNVPDWTCCTQPARHVLIIKTPILSKKKLVETQLCFELSIEGNVSAIWLYKMDWVNSAASPPNLNDIIVRGIKEVELNNRNRIKLSFGDASIVY